MPAGKRRSSRYSEMRATMTRREYLAFRFWEKVEKGEEDACWEWNGTILNGYGVLGHRVRIRHRRCTKNIRAHRLSYRLFVGRIGENMCVCHRCDNPSCVNPKHLFLGTQQDNQKDKQRKGRANHLPQTKLSKWEVQVIRQRRKDGKSIKVLASNHGVCLNTISRIIRGKLWKWVEEREMKKVIIRIGKDGKSRVSTHGYSGAACLEASKAIEAALGLVTDDQYTEEFYAIEKGVERVMQK